MQPLKKILRIKQLKEAIKNIDKKYYGTPRSYHSLIHQSIYMSFDGRTTIGSNTVGIFYDCLITGKRIDVECGADIYAYYKLNGLASCNDFKVTGIGQYRPKGNYHFTVTSDGKQLGVGFFYNGSVMKVGKLFKDEYDPIVVSDNLRQRGIWVRAISFFR